MLRNIFALIGLLAVLTVGYLYFTYRDDIAAVQGLDPQARQVYAEMWQRLKETGTSADATVWKVPLAEGITPEDAEQTMSFVANSHNIKDVGELPLSDQVAEMTGEDQRFLKIYQYCDPLTAMRMVDYSDAFSAYLPCRIAMVEDQQGKYALYSLNMDLMISGGRTLPPELLEEANRVREIIRDIMQRGATGEF
jgi:hypothetical protein